MPSSATAKTKLAHKRSWKFAVGMGGLVLLVVAASVWLWSHPAPMTELRTHTRTFKLEPAETLDAQRRGLSGRSAIAADEGMLFTFSEQDRQCMWMKNMRFPIDIIWLDTSRRVEHIESNVAPETYPEAFCHDAHHVIELGAGEATKAGIEQGQTLDF